MKATMHGTQQWSQECHWQHQGYTLTFVNWEWFCQSHWQLLFWCVATHSTFSIWSMRLARMWQSFERDYPAGRLVEDSLVTRPCMRWAVRRSGKSRGAKGCGDIHLRLSKNGCQSTLSEIDTINVLRVPLVAHHFSSHAVVQRAFQLQASLAIMRCS